MLFRYVSKVDIPTGVGNADFTISIRAEFFALQISEYSKAVKGFVRDSGQAAQLIWAAACALLEASLLVGALRLFANLA